MWLLDVASFKLKFFANPPPKYAILSHTWGDDEVLFGDMINIAQARNKAGWDKILYTCQKALADRLPYAWVDTCCINKSSSAELSEAINSMFEWYRQASLCYVFLYDLGPVVGGIVTKDKLAQCRWFTRGWTLQELIAPSEVVFLNNEWKVIGEKESLCEDLAEITGIDTDVLHDMERMAGVPVGRRMYWASRRETTRIEDIAYCLLGIFAINMPLLYGEGLKAFQRLQDEIARQHHNDLSLFAWTQSTPHPEYRGLFAHSPVEFSSCPPLVNRHRAFFSPPTMSMTNKDVLVEMPVNKHFNMHYFKMHLDCVRADMDSSQKWLTIDLRKFGHVHVREFPDKLTNASRNNIADAPTTVKIQKSLTREESDFMQLLKQRKLVLLYRSELVAQLQGIHTSSSFGMDWRYELGDVDTINGIPTSNFPLIHAFNIDGSGDPIWWYCFQHKSSSVKFALMCGTSLNVGAPSEYLMPWFAIFSPNSSTEFAREIYHAVEDHPRENCSIATQRQVGDAVFGAYADVFGNILQANMPTEVTFQENTSNHTYGVLLTRLGGPSSTFCVDVGYRRVYGQDS